MQFTNMKRPHECLFERNVIPEMICDLFQAFNCLYHSPYDFFEIQQDGTLHCRFDILHHDIDIYAPIVRKTYDDYLHIYFRYSMKQKSMYVKNRDTDEFKCIQTKHQNSPEMKGRRFVINECIQYLQFYKQKLVQFRFIYHIESNFDIQIKEKCDLDTKETTLTFHHSTFQPFHIIWNQRNEINFHFQQDNHETLLQKMIESNLLSTSLSIPQRMECDRIDIIDKILQVCKQSPTS
jgi:hypothetical protein